MSGLRRRVVVLVALLSGLLALVEVYALYKVATRVTSDPTAFRAGAVISLTGLGALSLWLPFAVWQAGNWLARLGLTSDCPSCSRAVATHRRRCACGQRLRPARDDDVRLVNRRAGQWPVRHAVIGVGGAIALGFGSERLLRALGVHLTVLLVIAVIDLALAGVALFVARLAGPVHPWQFGLRQTPVRLAIRTALIAFGFMIAADLAYRLLFGPFGSSGESFVGWSEPAGVIIAAVVLAPAAEEFLFRGFVYGTLRRRFARTPATLATSAMFASAHWLSHYPLWALVPIAIFSIASCLVYERTGSIWPCIALHAANNASIFESPALAALTLSAVVIATVALFQRTGSRRHRSSHWSLPLGAGTACAGLLALGGVFTISPTAAPFRLPRGFSTPGAVPAEGVFHLRGVVVSSSGPGAPISGEADDGGFEISGGCTRLSCGYYISVSGSLDPSWTQTTPLTRTARGWVARLSGLLPPCSLAGGSRQHDVYVFQFGAGGRTAVAQSATYFSRPGCYDQSFNETWSATHI